MSQTSHDLKSRPLSPLRRGGAGRGVVATLHLLLYLWLAAALPLTHLSIEAQRGQGPGDQRVGLWTTASGSEHQSAPGPEALSAASLSEASTGDEHALSCALCRAIETPFFLDDHQSTNIVPLLAARGVDAGIFGAPNGARPPALARGPPNTTG